MSSKPVWKADQVLVGCLVGRKIGQSGSTIGCSLDMGIHVIVHKDTVMCYITGRVVSVWTVNSKFDYNYIIITLGIDRIVVPV